MIPAIEHSSLLTILDWLRMIPIASPADPFAVNTAGDRHPAAALPKPAFSAICQAVLSKMGQDGSLGDQYD